jgi:hypothetical protein
LPQSAAPRDKAGTSSKDVRLAHTFKRVRIGSFIPEKRKNKNLIGREF